MKNKILMFVLALFSIIIFTGCDLNLNNKIPTGKFYSSDQVGAVLELKESLDDKNNFDINLSVIRLANFDGKGILNKNKLDVDLEIIKAQIVYDNKNQRLNLEVTESNFEYLPVGEKFDFDANIYKPDAQAFYDLFKDCTGYTGSAGASLKNSQNALNMLEFVYKTRFNSLDIKEIRSEMLKGYEKLTIDERNEFDNNFYNVIRPLVDSIFDNNSDTDNNFDDININSECDVSFFVNYDSDFEIQAGWQKLVANYYIICNSNGK